MKFRIIAAIILLLICGAALGSNTASVNLTIEQYVIGYFPISPTEPGIDYETHDADPINNTGSFVINIPAGATSGWDTVNMAWGGNCPSRVTLSFNPGGIIAPEPGLGIDAPTRVIVSPHAGSQLPALPGSWTMDFAGEIKPLIPFTPIVQDVIQLTAFPVTLTVTGINLSTLAGQYQGSLDILSVVPL